MSIQQNTALFSLLGTTYGGNGTTTFGLPDLRSRAVVGMGQGPGLSTYVQGEMTGTENVTLVATQMPAHNHILMASNSVSSSTPNGNVMLGSPSAANPSDFIYAAPPTNTTLNAGEAAVAGGNQPHANVMPTQCVNYIIALQGIYPSRN